MALATLSNQAVLPKEGAESSELQPRLAFDAFQLHAPDIFAFATVDGNLPLFGGVLELPVASYLMHLYPAICAQVPKNLAYFHYFHRTLCLNSTLQR